MQNKEYFSVIDIDHTVFPLDDAIHNVVKAVYPQEASAFEEMLHDEQSRSFTQRVQKRKDRMPQLAKLSGGELIRLSGNHEAYMNTPPYAGSKEFLEKLNEISDVVFLTARGTPENTNRSYDNGWELTQDWLQKHELPYDELIFHIHKEEAVKEYYTTTGKKPFLFFDDHEHYMAMMSLHEPPFKYLAMRELIHNRDFIYKNYGEIIKVEDPRDLIQQLGL